MTLFAETPSRAVAAPVLRWTPVSSLAALALVLGVASAPIASAAGTAAPAAAAAPAPATPATSTPAASSPTTVLATVNGKKITQEDLDLANEDIGPGISQQLQGKAKDAYILDYLIDGDLVAQKAAADKIAEGPDFAKKLAYAREKLLMETVLTQIAKTATSDAALHKIYDDVSKQQKPEEEIHARHILVPTEGDAETVEKRLKAGEDFAKVAKDMSKDPGSEGGELGWFTRDRMVPAFADAAFKLKDGEISAPVKSQFGWHVIQLEGRRQKTFPPFDQVKDQIARYAVQQAQSELIVALRKDAKIERTAAAPTADGSEMAPGDAAQAPAGK